MDRETKEEVLRLVEIKKRINEDKVLETWIPTPMQKLMLLDNHKILICMGANRSGKSDFLATDAIIRSLGVVPEVLKDEYPHNYIRPGRVWLSALTFQFMRDVTQEKVDKYLPKRLKKRYLKDDHIFELNHPDTIIGLKSQQAGVESYAGDSRVYVGYDEEHKKEIWDEGYMRTIDCEGVIRKSFAPLKGLTWAYRDLFLKASKSYYSVNKHGIEEGVGIVHTVDQVPLLKDREIRCKINTSAEAEEDIVVYQLCIYDNVHLPDSEIVKTERKYKNDIVNYNARVLGNFAKITGREVFNRDTLHKLSFKTSSTPIRGEVVKNQFVKSPKARLTLFKPVDELKNRKFVIGADVSEGLDDGDYSCAQILDHRTLEQVGIWHGHVSPEDLSAILVDLGRFFNYAWLAPERNFHGIGVVSRIRDHFKYPFLYCEYDISQEAVKQSRGSKAGEKKYGWDTNSKSKPLMIQNLGAAVVEGRTRVNDPNTIDELQTYVYKNNGKLGAQTGCFDDRVVAYAIALMVAQRRAPSVVRKTAYIPPPRDSFTGW